MPIRVYAALDEKAFDDLVHGKKIMVEAKDDDLIHINLILSDIGFAQMLQSIKHAMQLKEPS